MARPKKHIIINNPDILNAIEVIKRELIKRGKVEISNFGTLQLKTMPSRKGFNPGSNIYELFPSYVKMSFEPTKLFKSKIQLWNKEK